MSVVINTNYAATLAANNLASSSSSLQRSLNRLASGSKIINPQDDAAGLAVSMKLAATARRQNAASANLGNAVSFLQTQDGALQVAGKVLTRIGELKTLYSDPTKNADDLANYQAEFEELQTQLTSLGDEKFNGIALFGSSTMEINGTADPDGSSIAFGGADLMGSTQIFSENFANLSAWTSYSGTPTVSGNALSLDNGDSIITTQHFSGALEVSFTAQLGGAGSGFWLGYQAGGVASNLQFGSLINDTAAHSVKVVFDGAGNASTYLDGSSTAAQTQSSLSDNVGLVLENMIGGNGTVRNFSVRAVSGSSSATSTVADAGGLSSLDLSDVTSAIQQVATLRATNGSQQSRLQFADEVMRVNKANIEAANSRITDVDVAEESTALARFNILVQSGTAMLTQANQSAQMALRLLG